MKNVSPLKNINYQTKLKEIAALKRKGNDKVLLSVIPEIIDRFKFYKLNSKRLESITKSSPNIITNKDLLISLYDSPLKPANNILEKIKKLETKCCPYCGKHSIPETLDHYLPKDDYPEFSIFALNLIPACGKCNNLKNTKFLENNKRLFINPYFDDFLDKEFLKVNIIAPYKYPKFKIEIVDTLITHEHKELCERHIEALNLKVDFKIYFSNEIEWVSNLYTNKKITLSIIKDDLNVLLTANEKSFGKNNWKCCLYRAMINNEEFLKDFYKVI